MIAGGIIFLALVLTVMHFHREPNVAEQILFKAERVELVSQMSQALASASEAEKSAVLAITDQDSQKFADEAREATALVEQGRSSLGSLLDVGGTNSEKELLAKFSLAFTEYKRIDDDLLALAVQNTNLKAYSLAYGPAAVEITKMHDVLSRIVEESANSNTPEAKRSMLLASVAQASALQIQTLLAPHIAEESDQKMDDLEALMTTEDQKVRKSLEGLNALLKPKGNPDLETATAAYARFRNLRTQILKLSRENTNVHSLAISLNQKRKAMFACQAALTALDQAIRGEPVEGEGENAPTNPRKIL